MSERKMVALFIGDALAFVVVLVLVVNGFSRHYDRVNCTAFGQNSGRETRFVEYSYWSWACLTPTHTGRCRPGCDCTNGAKRKPRS